LRCRKRSVAQFMQESIVFLVRVQCRRKESSRSLSHLLMSFLYYKLQPKLTQFPSLQMQFWSVLMPEKAIDNTVKDNRN